jgi:hypothetical protein
VYRRLALALALAPLGATLAAMFSAGVAAAAEPQQPTFPPPEEDNGTERPFAPDQRSGHIYLSPTFGMVGGVGYAGPNMRLSSLIDLGYSVGGILGLGVSRHATVQIFGERSAFEAPGSCRSGCSASGFTLGVGVTYHLAQALAVDPWGSFGIAYRSTSFMGAAPTTATYDGTACTAGAVCPMSYSGIDVARIAFGGDFYPVPWFGLGPFVEVDAGTYLRQPYVTPPIFLPPNIGTGPQPYAYFHLGIRVTFDPMRRHSLPRPVGTPSTTALSPSAGLSGM